MKENNLISLDLEQKEIDEVNEHLDALIHFANKYSPGLTPKQRSSYGSVKKNNKLLVNKSRSLMHQYPEFIPQSVDLDSFEINYQNREVFEEIIGKVEQVLRNVSDIKILLDNENYQDVIAFYRLMKFYANDHHQVAMPLYEELKQFYANRVSKNSKKDEKAIVEVESKED